jgi:hypothetical protein
MDDAPRKEELKIKIKKNNNFEDGILKTNYFKQNNFNEYQWGETAM